MAWLGAGATAQGGKALSISTCLLDFNGTLLSLKEPSPWSAISISWLRAGATAQEDEALSNQYKHADVLDCNGTRLYLAEPSPRSAISIVRHNCVRWQSAEHQHKHTDVLDFHGTLLP